LQYGVHGDEVYVNLYAGGTAEMSVAATRVKLTQETRYPWDGAVKLTVVPEKPAAFTLRMRIPGWARNQPVPTDLYHYADTTPSEVSLTVNGQSQPVRVEKGYATLTRSWQPGDVVSLALAMPVRRVLANERVADDRGRVALERGPLVYCFEGVPIPRRFAGRGHRHQRPRSSDQACSRWQGHRRGGRSNRHSVLRLVQPRRRPNAGVDAAPARHRHPVAARCGCGPPPARACASS